MIGVSDITLIRNAGDHAEALLQTLGKLIGRALDGAAIEGVVDILLCLPLVTLVVHVLHDGQGERLALRVGMAFAGHGLYTLIKSGIPQGQCRVAAVEQFVDGLAFFQAGQGSILPMDGGGFGQRTAETLVPDLERPVAHLQPLVEDIPKDTIKAIFAAVTPGRFPAGDRTERHVGEVDGDDTLVDERALLPALTIS